MAFSAAISSGVSAASGIDTSLQADGIINENYVYTDISAASKYFYTLTEQYTQMLPKNLNDDVQINSTMMTPYFATIEASYCQPLTATEKNLLVEDISSVQSMQAACMDHFIPHEYMAANNYSLIFAFYDSDHQPLTNVTMTIDICRDALQQSL